MNITFTQEAKAEMRKAKDQGHHIKISFDRSGCCGYAYNIFEDVQRLGDEVIELDGLKLLATPRAKEMLESQKSEIYFGRRGLKKGFWIRPV